MRRSPYVKPEATAYDVASVVWVAGSPTGALVIETSNGEFVRWEPVSREVFDELVDNQSSFDGVLRRIARGTETVARSDQAAVVRRDPEATQIKLLPETADAVDELVGSLSVPRWRIHDAAFQTAIAEFSDVIKQLQENQPTANPTAYETIPFLMKRKTRKAYLRTVTEHQMEMQVVREAPRAAITEAMVVTAFSHSDKLNEHID